MAKKTRLLQVLTLLICMIVIAGCSRAPESGEDEPDSTTVASPVAPTRVQTPEPTPTPSPTPEPTPISPGVVMADQVLDESGVLIAEEVSLPASGWLTIYREFEGGPDAIIGRQSLTAGIHQDVEISVDIEQATETLFAGVHADLGAEGVFDYPGEDEPFPNEPETEFVVELAIPQPQIEVEEQTIGEDGVITLARLELLEPTWILIHADVDGEIGPVLGGLILDAGSYENVPLAIDWRKATPTLYAVFHKDGGEARVLEYPNDDLPMLRNGRPIVAVIKAVYPPEILVFDQPVVDNQIVVERVISNGPGWVAIYNELDGQPGFIIGHAPLTDGLNEQVAVSLLPSRLTLQLYARLHDDSEPGDDFNFPAQDPEVRHNGRLPSAVAFRTDETAHALVRDQQLGENNTVSVAYIVSAVNAWVAIFTDEDGQPGELLGHTRVQVGINRDVLIDLDPPPAAGVVHLHLYEDLGQSEEFEAATIDIPLDNNDNRPIRIPFAILP